MKKPVSNHIALALLSALVLATNYLSCATDPPPMQDHCIAVPDDYKTGYNNKVHVNGKFCKDPKRVTSKDFICSGVQVETPTRAFSTLYDVDSCPALNTLSISASVSDYASGETFPLQYHPRASELVICTKGSVFGGFFASTDKGSKFYGQILRTGEAIAIPQAAPHIFFNPFNAPAQSFSIRSSQNPGLVNFNLDQYKSAISLENLTQEFSLEKKTIEMIWKNN